MAVRLRTPADVGALIRARRRAQRLDQATLARHAGVSRLWIGEIEKGKPGASLGLVLRVLGTLGVDLLAPEPDEAERGAAETPPPVETPDIDAIIARARGRRP